MLLKKQTPGSEGSETGHSAKKSGMSDAEKGAFLELEKWLFSNEILEERPPGSLTGKAEKPRKIKQNSRFVSVAQQDRAFAS